MSNLIRVDGDLIKMAKQGEFDIIIHGCNCFCAMGSGIARQIRNEFPSAWVADNKTSQGSPLKLGTWSEADEYGVIVINAYTQYAMNRGTNNDLFEYSAFSLILRKLEFCYRDVPGARFGLPMIGMGLAGGNPDRILKIIEDWADRIPNPVTLVTYKP